MQVAGGLCPCAQLGFRSPVCLVLGWNFASHAPKKKKNKTGWQKFRAEEGMQRQLMELSHRHRKTSAEICVIYTAKCTGKLNYTETSSLENVGATFLPLKQCQKSAFCNHRIVKRLRTPAGGGTEQNLFPSAPPDLDLLFRRSRAQALLCPGLCQPSVPDSLCWRKMFPPQLAGEQSRVTPAWAFGEILGSFWLILGFA